MIQRSLRYVVIVQVAVALKRGLQRLLGVKAVARQYVTDPAVEALHHAVGLRAAHRGEPVLDTRLGAELVEDMLATGGALLALQPVGERLVVVGEELADAERRLCPHGLQERPGPPPSS